MTTNSEMFSLGRLGAFEVSVEALPFGQMVHFDSETASICVNADIGNLESLPNWLRNRKKFIELDRHQHLDLILEETSSDGTISLKIDFDYGDAGWGGSLNALTSAEELEVFCCLLENKLPDIVQGSEDARRKEEEENREHRANQLRRELAELEVGDSNRETA